MDIVLGVSMTPTTVRMVLVEGEKADGVTVDHDVFDITAIEGGATTSASDQVVAAVLGTQESAAAGGHHLKSMGVAWTDHGEAAVLRDTLAARGIEDVMLVSELHAAAALAQAVGRAVGYETTALFFIERDTATLSVVQTDDGSVVKVLSRSLHRAGAMAVLAEMAAAVDAQDSRTQGMFVVGCGGGAGARVGPWCGPGVGERARVRGLHRRPGLLAGSGRDDRGQCLPGGLFRRGHADGARQRARSTGGR